MGVVAGKGSAEAALGLGDAAGDASAGAGDATGDAPTGVGDGDGGAEMLGLAAGDVLIFGDAPGAEVSFGRAAGGGAAGAAGDTGDADPALSAPAVRVLMRVSCRSSPCMVLGFDMLVIALHVSTSSLHTAQEPHAGNALQIQGSHQNECKQQVGGGASGHTEMMLC